MAVLTSQTISVAGVEPVYTPASVDGDRVEVGQRSFIHVRNTGATAASVIIDDPNSVGPTGATAFNPDVTVNVDAGSSAFIGPLIESRFRSAVDGRASITYSDASDLEIAALKI